MKNFLIAALFFLSFAAFAQTNRLVPAVVQSAQYGKPGEWRVIVDKPDGITAKDDNGFVVGLYDPANPYRNLLQAFAKNQNDKDNTIEIAFTGVYEEIKVGDVFLFEVALPEKINHKGILYKLALTGIFPTQADGKPYFTFEQSISKATEDAALAKMLADVKASAATATPQSLQTFLVSMEKAPQVYWGRALNLATEYGHWVKIGSPDYSLIDAFVKVLDKKTDFDNLKKTNAAKLTHDFLINQTNGASVNHSAQIITDGYFNTIRAIEQLLPNTLTGNDLGFLYFQSGSARLTAKQYHESAGLYALAAKTYKGINDVQYARSIARLAEAQESFGDYGQSLETFKSAVELWKALLKTQPSHYNISRLTVSLEGVAYAANELEDYDLYIATYNELLSVYGKLNQKYERGNAYWNMGYAYGSKKKLPDESNQNYERAYQIFDSLKNIKNAVIVLSNKAINYRSQKDYKKALEAGQRAEAYAQANLNSEYEGYALENIMQTFKALKNYPKAVETAKKAEKIYGTLNMNEKLASLYDDLVSLYADDMEKPDEAAAVSRQALKAYETFATGKVLADAYWNTGYYLSQIIAYKAESTNCYQKAFNYFKDTNPGNATTLLSNIAYNARDVDDSTACYKQHREAVKFAHTSKDTTAIITAHEKFYHSYKHFSNFDGMIKEAEIVADWQSAKGDETKAEDFFDKVTSAYDSIITRFDKQERYDDVANYYLKKSSLFKKQNNASKEAEGIFMAGYYKTFGKSTNPQADGIALYKKSRAMYNKLDGYKGALGYIDMQIAKAFQKMNKLDSADWYLKSAVALTEANESYSYLGDAYKQWGEMLSDQKKYDGPDGTIALYQKAIEAYGKVPDVTKQMSLESTLATLLKDLERYEEASKQYLDRIKQTDPADESALASAYWDYAFSLSNVPRLKESNEYYQKAADLFKKSNNNADYASVMSNIGYNYRDANDSVSAYRTFRDLLKYLRGGAESNYKTKNLSYALEKAGHTYKHFGNHTQAMKVRVQSAEGYKSVKDFDKACTLYEDAGKSADAAKRYTLAEKYYKEAVAMATQLNDKSKKANAIWNLAYSLGTNQKRNREALPMWEEAYTLFLEAGDTANASVMRSNVGQESWTLLDFDKAIENHLKAIDIATKGKYLTQVAYSWRKLADLYKKTNNAVKETEATVKVIEMQEILKDTAELLSSYFDIAYSLTNAQEVSKADSYLDKALKMAMRRKDSTNIAWAYYKFAGLYHSRDLDKANKYYEMAAPLQRKIGDKTNLIYTMASHGSLIMEKDRPRSEKMLNDAIDIATQLEDDNILAYCHGRLYDLYRTFGKPDVAHGHWETSTKLYQKSHDQVSITNNYISFANEYLYDYGDFTKAQEYMAKAKALLDSINNPLTNAYFHGQQSDIYGDQGQYDLALAELDKSSEIYLKYKNDWGMAGNYIEYGNLYRNLSDYADALKYQGKADSIYQVLHLEYQRLAPIANIGDVYFDQGDYPKALDYFRRSLKYMEDNKDQNTNICKLYSAVGITYNNMEQYDEAEKWLLKGLETSKRINATRVHADILNYLGKLKIETKKFDEAEKYLIEAKTFLLAQKLMLERTTNATHLGHLYVKKESLDKAKTELTEAIELGEKFGKDAVLWEAYFRMGQYYRKSKNLKEAKDHLFRSVHVVEKLRNNVVGGEEAKKLFSSDKWIMEAYEELISVLLELGETEEAMAWLQKINENNVRDKIRSMDVTFEDDSKNKALAQEKELKMKLEALEKQIAAQKQAKVQNAEQLKQLENIRTVAEGDYLKFVNQQVNVQPELSKYFSNTVQPSQLKGKKKQIPKDMALVSYLVGEKQLYIFVATSDTVVARIVPTTKEKIHRDVNAMINITKSHLGNFGSIDLKTQEAERKEMVRQAKQTDQMLKPFEEAYNYLISPIGELIANKSKLGVIATGELNYIPFQLLGKTLNSGKFSLLINQYSLFYTNSTDMLLRGAPESKAINILAFGNPDKTLPATEKEVKDIQKIFPNAKVYVRDEATEDKAKYAPEEYNVMHFATHGNLDYEDFSKSYLTMAGNSTKNEDGMLTLEELWGMEVMSHLNIVVLSACQTAVTKGSDESSPVSPASGFLQNGVKSVVATLWKVDDEATSILMNDFYTNIKTMDAVDAMRMAQSKLASNPKFSHPYYWAAMVLIGDWR